MNYIDLHTHSTFSDGTLSPTALLEAAGQAGLSAIALTDHDTLAGLDEAENAGKTTGIEVIPGVELSANHNGASIHILGYWIDRTAPELLELLTELQTIRNERNQKILAKLADRGIDIDSDELYSEHPGLIGRPHIARLLVRKKVVRSIDQAFHCYLKKNGLAYAAAERFPAVETIRTIKNVGGLAVLAHPTTSTQSPNEIERQVTFLRDHGLDGIEAIYPGHSTRTCKRLSALAEKLGMVVTGGSDFHSTVKHGINIGGAPIMPPVPYILLEKMRDRLGDN